MISWKVIINWRSCHWTFFNQKISHSFINFSPTSRIIYISIYLILLNTKLFILFILILIKLMFVAMFTTVFSLIMIKPSSFFATFIILFLYRFIRWRRFRFFKYLSMEPAIEFVSASCLFFSLTFAAPPFSFFIRFEDIELKKNCK